MEYFEFVVQQILNFLTIIELFFYYAILSSIGAPIASFVMWGLLSLLSGSVQTIIVPYAADCDWGTQL